MSRSEEEDKPCRACSDFKTWANKQSKSTLAPPSKTNTPKDCPLDKEDLGKSTWGFLHSMAGYYPDKPTKSQAEDMSKFFQIFAQFYPCEPCALDFQEDIKKNPPKTKTQAELANWLCERHNTVNIKLGKPVFDCSKVNERWKEGWKDGSCD
ncbi:FAD-linked sulfhydryl oxidase ALR [Pectinophora gossypiella]|uniref:FAD-linked sulfhydryl oxidase ALR n=1 Tax=Pectinophora gossypiella TaxID=13191 RepID=UPI00214EC91C|nr:FAD-linked sulfhydryl oxidase ALR [Pectinophora gossypiella]